jgi:hypothetical protein
VLSLRLYYIRYSFPFSIYVCAVVTAVNCTNWHNMCFIKCSLQYSSLYHAHLTINTPANKMKPKSGRPFIATDANKVEHKMPSWRLQMRISRPGICSITVKSTASTGEQIALSARQLSYVDVSVACAGVEAR